MVLTSIALVSATEIWNFFVEHDLHDIAFNPEEVKGVNVASTIHAQNFIEAYQSFLETIADLREKSGLNIKVRELDTFMARIKYGSGEIYSTLNNPFSILNFDYNGNFSTYCPELLTAQNSRFGNFILGNVHHHSLESILQSKKFHAIYQEIESGKQQCLSECEFFEVCGGGNPSNKMSENNSFDSSETMNCQFTIQSNCRAVLSFLERQMQIA